MMVSALDRIAVSTTVASNIRCTDAAEYSPLLLPPLPLSLPFLLPSPPPLLLLSPVALSLLPLLLLAGSGLNRITPGPEKTQQYSEVVQVSFSLTMETTYRHPTSLTILMHAYIIIII